MNHKAESMTKVTPSRIHDAGSVSLKNNSGPTAPSLPLRLYHRMLLGVGVAALLFLQAANAATYYVATTGSDTTGTGTESNPWRTINYGCSRLASGDTLFVKSGTYAESLLNPLPSGISGSQPTTITGPAAPNRPILRPTSDGPAGNIILLNANRSNILFKNLVLDGSAYSGVLNAGLRTANSAVITGLRVEDCEIIGKVGVGDTAAGITIDKETVAEVRRCRIHGWRSNTSNPGAHGFYWRGSNGIVEDTEIFNNNGMGLQFYWGSGSVNSNIFRRNYCYNNDRRGIYLGTGSDNHVYNNVFANNGLGGINLSSSSASTGRLIYNNTIYNNGGYGIQIQGGGGAIRNNIIHLNASGAITGSQTNYTVSHNFTSNPNFVNAGAGDFHVLGTSGAIDYGVTLSLVTTDKDGVGRPQGSAYDAGAYEYVFAPAAPSNLTATKAASPNNYRQINLSWTDNASNETGFKIERKKGSGGTYSQIATTGANVVAYNDTTCGSGTTYYYRVRAYNGSGDSSYSPEANATTDEVTSGRRGHWKLDASSGTTATDSSGNSNTGTLSNGPTWVAGKIGNGLNFDGVDDIVNCGSGSTLDNLPALTVCAWIKANTTGEGGIGRMVKKGTGTASPVAGWEFNVYTNNALQFRVDYSGTDLNRRSASQAIGTGAWYHVMVTWTGSATATNAKLYVNGAEVPSYAVTTNASSSRVDDAASSLYIGNEPGLTRTFDGIIDDARVYNRVITADERLAIYRAGL